MEHMELYNRLRTAPENAKKEIRGGRLKGMTDINPMWRIQALTEQFGPCGMGWSYEIVSRELRESPNGEIAAFVDILLSYRDPESGEWSRPIPGTGGAMFAATERSGLYTSDECMKMALTDALSVACKALGMAADVYWEKGRTKYDQPRERVNCEECGGEIAPYDDGRRLLTAQQLAERSREMFGKRLCAKCSKLYGKRMAEGRVCT